MALRSIYSRACRCAGVSFIVSSFYVCRSRPASAQWGGRVEIPKAKSKPEGSSRGGNPWLRWHKQQTNFRRLPRLRPCRLCCWA
jgi:hypothetical protein